MEQHMNKKKEINIKACLKTPKYVAIRREFVKFVDEEAAAKGLNQYSDKEETLNILDSDYPEQVSISIMESYMYRCYTLDEAMKRDMDGSKEDQLKTLITTMNTIIMKEAMEAVEERVRTLRDVIQEWSPHTEAGWNEPVFGDELHANVVLYDKYLVTKEHLNTIDDKIGSLYGYYPFNKISGDWWYTDNNEDGEE